MTWSCDGVRTTCGNIQSAIPNIQHACMKDAMLLLVAQGRFEDSIFRSPIAEIVQLRDQSRMSYAANFGR